eukprot:jgi/Mesen1/7647/ME000004S07914
MKSSCLLGPMYSPVGPTGRNTTRCRLAFSRVLYSDDSTASDDSALGQRAKGHPGLPGGHVAPLQPSHAPPSESGDLAAQIKDFDRQEQNSARICARCRSSEMTLHAVPGYLRSSPASLASKPGDWAGQGKPPVAASAGVADAEATPGRPGVCQVAALTEEASTRSAARLPGGSCVGVAWPSKEGRERVGSR